MRTLRLQNTALAFVFCITEYAADAQSEFQQYAMNVDGSRVTGVAITPTGAHGTIMATVNEGALNLTFMDSLGSVQSSFGLTTNSGTGFTDVMNIATIDGGPACYVLAMREGYGQTDFYSPFVLIELDDQQQIVLARQYVDIWGNCNVGLNGVNARAYRKPSGGYVISIPQNPNFTCLYGLDAEGDTLFTRLYEWTFGGQGSLAGSGSLQLSDGSLLLLNTSGANWHYLQLMRVDVDGNYIWSHTYIDQYDYSYALTAAQTDTDSVVVVGRHQGWGFLMKMDFNGNIGWHRRFALLQGGPVQAGTPEEIHEVENGDLFVRLDLSGQDMIVRFNALGELQEMVQLFVPAQPWTGFYDDLRLTGEGQELILAGAVQYYGSPWWNDSVLVASIHDLCDLGCYAEPYTGYDEPDTGVMTVQDDGAMNWSGGFRTAAVPCSIGSIDWTSHPYCLSTDVKATDDPVMVALYPSLAKAGEIIRLAAYRGPIKNVAAIDANGRSARVHWSASDQGISFSTNGLTSGMYLIRFSLADERSLSARLVITD